jgi:serine kinase of HPr protein (carbohydrate metabolism regulator)
MNPGGENYSGSATAATYRQLLTVSPHHFTLPSMERIRGTCVAVDGRGILLRGPSGAGKSDLALRLIDEGGRLVSDDYTDIEDRDGRLFASAPPEIRGMLEVRGFGVLRVISEHSVGLDVVIDLTSADAPRMPASDKLEILGIFVPIFKLAPFEASAPAKVRLAVRLATGGIMQVP